MATENVALMVMPADAMHMSMGQFFGRSTSCFHHFNVEDQRPARQGMVGIDIGSMSAGLGHCDCAHPVAGAKLYYSARA